jgi:hypothetical protein
VTEPPYSFLDRLVRRLFTAWQLLLIGAVVTWALGCFDGLAHERRHL